MVTVVHGVYRFALRADHSVNPLTWSWHVWVHPRRVDWTGGMGMSDPLGWDDQIFTGRIY